MTEHSEQLTQTQRAGAFEWLAVLSESDALTESDRAKAQIALRAWEEDSRLAAASQALKSSLAHCNQQYRRMANALGLLPETPVETIVETADHTNLERARWKFLLHDAERAAGFTSFAVTPDATHIVNRVQELAQAFDLRPHLERQRAWSERTFGPGARTQGVIDHIRKELREIAENPGDLEEWIDVVILALDGAWRTGATPDAIIEALIGKQTKNEQREWPDWRTMPADQAIEHERSGESTGTEPEDDLDRLETMASAGADGASREAIITTVARIRARTGATLSDIEQELSDTKRELTDSEDRVRALEGTLHSLRPYVTKYGEDTYLLPALEGNATAHSADREVTGADIIDWADGIRGALGTEHASKVTAQEARIADAIVKAMPDPSEASRGQNSEIASQEMMAIGSTLRFVDLVVKPRRCDSDGVSGCWRCQTVYLASVVLRMLPELNHAN